MYISKIYKDNRVYSKLLKKILLNLQVQCNFRHIFNVFTQAFTLNCSHFHSQILLWMYVTWLSNMSNITYRNAQHLYSTFSFFIWWWKFYNNLRNQLYITWKCQNCPFFFYAQIYIMYGKSYMQEVWSGWDSINLGYAEHQGSLSCQPWVFMGHWFQDCSLILKSKHAQISHIKWCAICI